MDVKVCPVAKPRMTRRDKWMLRPCVAKYRAYKDELRLNMPNYVLPAELDAIIFYIPMPDSWSETHKKQMWLKPHQQKPDVDNYIKGFMDTFADNDSYVWHVNAYKRWDYQGHIQI